MFQSNLHPAPNAMTGLGSVKLFALTAVLCLFALSCSTTDRSASNAAPAANSGPLKSAPPPTPDAAAVAADVYTQNCSICHRDTGKGGKLILDGKSINPEDLTAEKIKKMTDEKLIGYVTNGIEDEGMPAFKDKLTADEIKQTVSHVRALQAK